MFYNFTRFYGSSKSKQSPLKSGKLFIAQTSASSAGASTTFGASKTNIHPPPKKVSSFRFTRRLAQPIFRNSNFYSSSVFFNLPDYHGSPKSPLKTVYCELFIAQQGTLSAGASTTFWASATRPNNHNTEHNMAE